jgi:hypothetical protein
MMNVLAGPFLAIAGDRFEHYQVVFCFLNLLLFLPCCLMLPRFAGPRRTAILPLVALFAASPAIAEHATFTWTKAFTAFYVVLAVYFYLAGWSKRDGARMFAGFLALSAGMLAHYSAGPYAVFLTLHFLLVVFRTRPRKWREAFVIAACCGLFLATWFEWSRETYGLHRTLESNTSVSTSRQYTGRNLEKIAGNLYDSLVPAALHNPAYFSVFQQPLRAGWVRDIVFMSYQANALFDMGILGGPLALWLMLKSLRRPPRGRAERNFWLVFVPFVALLGIATTGERDPAGSAHLTLLSLAALGIALVASAFPWRPAVTALVIAGCLIDFSLGIFLNVHLESLENAPGAAIFAVAPYSNLESQRGMPVSASLSSYAWENWAMKHRPQVTQHWLDSLDGSARGAAPASPSAPALPATLQKWMQEDGRFWHGWYARHGGQVTFLGDRVAASFPAAATLAEALLILLMLTLLLTLARRARRAIPGSGHRARRS